MNLAQQLPIERSSRYVVRFAVRSEFPMLLLIVEDKLRFEDLRQAVLGNPGFVEAL